MGAKEKEQAKKKTGRERGRIPPKRLLRVLAALLVAGSILAGYALTAYAAYVDENGAKGAHKSETCPYGGKWEHIGDACCYGCTTSDYKGGEPYKFRGKVNLTEDLAKTCGYYKNEDPDDHNGPGVTYVTSTLSTYETADGGEYTNVKKVSTYDCYNCSGSGKQKNDPSLLVKTEYIDSGGNVIDVEYGPRTPKGQGDVAVRWCSYCGPKGAGYIITKFNPWHWPKPVITIKYVSTDGKQLKPDDIFGTSYEEKFKFSTTVEESITVGDAEYTYVSARWKLGGSNRDTTSTTIKLADCMENVTITCQYQEIISTPTPTVSPTPTPTPVPGTYNIKVVYQFYTTNTESGETTHDGEEEDTLTVTEGEDEEINIAKSQVYDGENYTAETPAVDGACGLKASSGGNGYIVSGTVTGNGTVYIKCTRTFSPPPHVCTYGPWEQDESRHWKECEECKTIGEEGLHEWESSEPDDTGQITKTCTVCGRTESVHRHEWVGWYPTEYWGAHFDENEWHWKVCYYCDKASFKGKHVAGEPKNEGWGYLVTRCTVCGWIMALEPITVTLTLNPNGGTFPDGSTERKTFTLRYEELSDLGNIGDGTGENYIPASTTGVFTGFYIISPSYEGVFYDQNGLSGSTYFTKNEDGTYACNMKQDYTVHAQYRQGEHVVSYNPNGAENGIMYPSYFKMNKAQALSPVGYSSVTTITYDTGGVEAVVQSSQANTRKYWTFKGWSLTETGAVKYTDSQTVTFPTAGSTELFARWEYGSITLPDAKTTNDGLKLSGWKTKDGTVISVLDSSGNFKNTTYTLSGEDETLTAVWTANRYTVTFDSNGGSSCSPVTVVFKQPYGTLPTPAKSGNIFLGWKHKTTGVDIVAASVVTTAGNHTLVAQWEPEDVTIRLDYNFDYGKAVSVYAKYAGNSPVTGLPAKDWQTDAFTIKFGSAVGSLPIPEMEGYTFAGWYTEEKNGIGCGENAHMVQASTVPSNVATYTYYARWTKEEYRVDLDYNRDYSVWEE